MTAPDTTTDRAPPMPARPRRRRRRAVVGVLAVTALVAVAVGLAYRDQLVRYATHRKGSPTHTVAWTPFPAGAPPILHLAVAGDVGDSGQRIDATGQTIAAVDAQQPLDGLVVLGDNVYPSGDPAGLDDTVYDPFAGVLEHAPLFAVLGNHDVKDGNAARQVDALGMPDRWWAHDFGDVLLIGLDSNLVHDPDQRAWLEDTLAESTDRWRIVLVHHPPYSAGYQGSEVEVRRTFVPLFERFDVQLVLSGHDHDYQRSKPVNGVTYVVSGAASGTRRTGEDDFTAESFSWHHFTEVAVFADRLVVRAVNQDLRVADEAVILPAPTGG